MPGKYAAGGEAGAGADQSSAPFVGMPGQGVGPLLPARHIGLISISDVAGIGFGQRLTHATASSMEGSSQSQ